MASEQASLSTPAEGEKVFKYRWPPFPAPPQGKKILSFNEYKAKGIRPCPDSDEGEEFDEDGVKTVKLLVTHQDPAMKAANERAKRARKRRKGPQGPGLAPVPLTEAEMRKYWYEEWEDNRHRERSTSMDPAASRDARFHQIIVDFGTDRAFPPSVKSLYDNFRLFVGLMANTQNPPGSKHARKQQNAMQNERMEMSDDEGGDDDDDSSGNVPFDPSGDEEPAPPPKPDIPAIEEIPKPETASKRMWPKKENAAPLTQQEKMDRFLDDPRSALKLFFTSYAYDKGMLWDEDKRRNAPILVAFILQFIKRHNALREYHSEFDKALELLEDVKVQQVAVGEVANLIPDPFAIACREFWGYFRHNLNLTLPESSTEAPRQEPPAAEPSGAMAGGFVPDAPPGSGLVEVEEADQALGVDGGWGAAAQDGGEESGDAANGWGTTDEAAAAEWGQPQPEWNIEPQKHFLTDYYAKYPDEYCMVRVENGLRKIVSVEPPNPNSASEFRKPVGVIVLAPWPVHIATDRTCQPYPTLLLDAVEGVVDIPPHNPLEDVIRVYVDPSIVEPLSDRIGMGLSGQWIEVAQKKGSQENNPTPAKKKKGKSKDQDSPTHWWYLENCWQVVQTYWTE